ncbi:hypothetical protein I3A86_25110, partial [Salmonella enterica]|nr:hypothetical protein [Salmonella enterica]
MSKFFDFIEIGTSDFDALIQVADEKTIGLSIDAVPAYLDRLPSQAGCIKLNAGISDRDGETEVFFVSPHAIRAHGLPDWVRGCSTIGRPHPTVLALLDAMKLPLAIV